MVSAATPKDCTAAVADVFARSGFIELPTPPHLSMFFAARVSGPYSSFMRTGAGVGVTLDGDAAAAGVCRVTLEALSPDATCADPHGIESCGFAPPIADPLTMTPHGSAGSVVAATTPPTPACGVIPTTTCPLSYAPGGENDAAVDELARRVRAALGPNGRVGVD